MGAIHLAYYTVAQVSPPSSSTCDISKYRYAPLFSASQIRLLRLLPGGWDDPTNCVLETVELKGKPSYRALSYTWRPPKTTVNISVGDNYLDVTELPSYASAIAAQV